MVIGCKESANHPPIQTKGGVRDRSLGNQMHQRTNRSKAPTRDQLHDRQQTAKKNNSSG
jgi:hypothetical protein